MPATAATPYLPYNAGLLDAVGAVILGLLRGPACQLAMRASTTRTAPPGPDWRPWPWLTRQTFSRVRGLTAERESYRLVGEAGRRLAERGSVEIACTPLSRCRPRIRFARVNEAPALFAVEPEPLEVPTDHERRYYEPVEGTVVGRVADHLLDLLSEDIGPDDERSMRAACCSRTPPAGEGWRPWGWVLPRLVARAGLPVSPARARQLAGWAALRLSRESSAELAVSPIRGASRGRLRFVRAARP